MKFVVEVDDNTKLSPELIEYIFDCWVEFVTQDLGFEPYQLMMTAE